MDSPELFSNLFQAEKENDYKEVNIISCTILFFYYCQLNKVCKGFANFCILFGFTFYTGSQLS